MGFAGGAPGNKMVGTGGTPSFPCASPAKPLAPPFYSVSCLRVQKGIPSFSLVSYWALLFLQVGFLLLLFYSVSCLGDSEGDSKCLFGKLLGPSFVPFVFSDSKKGFPI